MNRVKILQINTWGGRIKDGLSNFISEGNYDVVCMQEASWGKGSESDFLTAFIDTVDKIKEQGKFDFDFRSPHYGITLLDGKACYEAGNTILSKIPFKKTEEKVLLGEYILADSLPNYEKAVNDHQYTAQKVVLENGLALFNYHGYWIKDPLGNEKSVECMKEVADMIKDEELPKVLCGDLNVISSAPCMRELDFLTDLTAKHDLKTTLRNIRFKKDVPCDHILISDNLSYENFQVISAPVSDHMALSIEILI